MQKTLPQIRRPPEPALELRTGEFQQFRKEWAARCILAARETGSAVTAAEATAVWKALQGERYHENFLRSHPSSILLAHYHACAMARAAMASDIPQPRSAYSRKLLPRWFRERWERALGNFDHFDTSWYTGWGKLPGSVPAWLRTENGYKLDRVFCTDPILPEATTLAGFIAAMRDLLGEPLKLARALHCRLRFSHSSTYNWTHFRLMFWPWKVEEELLRFRPRYDLRTCDCGNCAMPGDDEVTAAPMREVKLRELGRTEPYGSRRWSRVLHNPPYHYILAE